jgi:peptidoglycan/xylan/chitin deacetylase (PgdA/CDA1 family)
VGVTVQSYVKLVKSFLRRRPLAINRINVSKTFVALTFDDGPDPNSTPDLLDILDQHQAKATFFVVGANAEQHPELVKRIADSGHSIGLHSWDHPSFPSINWRSRQKQMKKAWQSVKPYGSKLFRPPYGHQTFLSYCSAIASGYLIIGWNINGEDCYSNSAEYIYTKISSTLKSGDIILLHDSLYTFEDPSYRDRTPMLAAVSRLLSEAGKEYEFVTLDQLLEIGTPSYKIWARA